MKEVHVLLVDDDEINRLVATTFLRKWDVGVTVATNGKEALDHIQSKIYQMVMMDLHMPEMDGYECTSKIRAMEDPYFKNVPIIVFSASYTIDSKRKAMEYGMTDFMNKPFRHEELQEKIAAYTTHGSGAAEAPADKEGVRPLYIDFDQHTDGDPVFKAELVQLLVENINELKQALDVSVKGKEPQIFLKTCHKVYTAIVMLNDSELTQTVDKIRNTMRQPINPSDPELISDVKKMNGIGEAVSKALERELKSIKNSSLNK